VFVAEVRIAGTSAAQAPTLAPVRARRRDVNHPRGDAGTRGCRDRRRRPAGTTTVAAAETQFPSSPLKRKPAPRRTDDHDRTVAPAEPVIVGRPACLPAVAA
jgi:hypothetical protein